MRRSVGQTGKTFATKPPAVRDDGIGGAFDHEYRDCLRRVARGGDDVRHTRDKQPERCEHFGIYANHAQCHEPAVRGPGNIDTFGIGNSTPNEIGNNRFQERDIVGNATNLPAHLHEAGCLLAGGIEIPATTGESLREGRCKTPPRRDPAET